MTVLATISAQEHQTLLETRYVNNYFEVLLLDAPGEVYQPGTTSDATFLAFEVTAGTAGYRRKVFSYATNDILAYSDRGMGLNTKAAVFAHDGSLTTLDFTHVALVRGTGNIISLVSTLTSTPTAGNDGTYLGVPTTTNADGIGATLDITVTNGDTFEVTIAYPGYGYTTSDTLSVSDSILAGLGVITAGAGGLSVGIDAVSVDLAGDLVSVAPTSDAVSLANGNEAVFYFNLKHFGYSTTAGA